MITKEEIKDNINTNWKMTMKTLLEYKYGLCKFIVDTANEKNLSKEVTALAMQIVNYFFIKNSYFSHDKLNVACSALTLSIKSKASKTFVLNDIFMIYMSKKKNVEIKDLIKVPNAEIKNLRDQIFDKELSILKLFNNLLPDEFPFEYAYLYSIILYPNNQEEIYNFAKKICIDSYFTYANNLYQPYVVALACIFFAAKFLDISTFLDKNFKNLEQMKFIHQDNMNEKQFLKALYKYEEDPAQLLIKQNKNENENESIDEENKYFYFNCLSLDKKLHPLLKMKELLECIEMISDFYEEMSKNYDLVNNEFNFW
jgi:hypothetical protein